MSLETVSNVSKLLESTNGSVVKESYLDYIDSRIPPWLFILLLLVGLFGNLISIWVFCQKTMRKNSTFVYLAFLCLVDMFVICFGIGDFILISYFALILRNQSLLLCRMHTFALYTFTHLSSFILASVSIDRAIATNLINYAKFYCKPKVANRVIVVNCLLAVAINCHSLMFLGYNEQLAENQTSSAKFECSSLNNLNYHYFLEEYFSFLDLIFYAIGPFIIMAFCTFFIIRVMFKSNRRLRKSFTHNSSVLVANLKLKEAAAAAADAETVIATGGDSSDLLTNTVNNGLEKSTRNSGRRATIRLTKFGRASMSAGSSGNGRLNKTLHLTYTLISINVLFFLLVSPLVILRAVVDEHTQLENATLVWNVIYLLAYSNHSFNFIFYGLSSPPYRNCVIRLLAGWRRTGENVNGKRNSQQFLQRRGSNSISTRINR